MREENVSLLKENGKIFYLRASAETLAQRLKGDTTRPLLKTGDRDLKENLAKKLEERAPVYEKVADFIIDVEGKNPGQIAVDIVSMMQEIK